MSSEKLRTQLQFESVVSGNNPIAWQSLTKSQIKNFAFNASHIVIFESALSEDSLDFYYKGLLSLIEGIVSANHKNYSWATVKLYYSVYYFLRCSLCCNNIAFVRKERDGYFFENKLAETPKANGKPDHIAAIDLFKQFFSGTDFLQSNSINANNSYDWLRHQRENINYRYRTFFEPDIPAIWETISQESDDKGIDFWIQKYINEDIYSFLDDHAVIALPIRRLMLTHSDLVAHGYRTIVRPDKLVKLNDILRKEIYLTYLRNYFRAI